MDEPRVQMDLSSPSPYTSCEGSAVVGTLYVRDNPTLTASSTYTDDSTGAIIDYYEIQVKSIKQQIYPDLPATTLFAYDGLQPGPTFIMQKGRGKFCSHRTRPLWY
jgi:hypothetical protein